MGAGDTLRSFCEEQRIASRGRKRRVGISDDSGGTARLPAWQHVPPQMGGDWEKGRVSEHLYGRVEGVEASVG